MSCAKERGLKRTQPVTAFVPHSAGVPFSQLNANRWNIDEVKSGDAFRYYFNTNIETKPVVEKWSASKYRYIVPEYHKDSTNSAGGSLEDGDFSEGALDSDAALSAGDEGNKENDGRVGSFMEQLKSRQ